MIIIVGVDKNGLGKIVVCQPGIIVTRDLASIKHNERVNTTKTKKGM